MLHPALTEITDPTKITIRMKIVNAIADAMREAPFYEDGVIADGDPRLFEEVIWGTMDDLSGQTKPNMAYEQGDEEKTPNLYDVTDKKFRLYIHFKVPKVQGIDPTAMITYYFGRIVKILVTPNHFADLALDVEEVGNSVEAQGPRDPEPGGTVFFDIDYRHAYGDLFTEA